MSCCGKGKKRRCAVMEKEYLFQPAIDAYDLLNDSLNDDSIH